MFDVVEMVKAEAESWSVRAGTCLSICMQVKNSQLFFWYHFGCTINVSVLNLPPNRKLDQPISLFAARVHLP